MPTFKVALATGNYHHIRDGVSITLNRWVQFLLDQDVDVRIFAPTVKAPQMDAPGTLIPVRSFPIPFRPEYRLSTGLSREAKHELEAFDPDIIQIATPDRLGFDMLSWAKHHKKPVAATYHTNFVSYLSYYGVHWLTKWVQKTSNDFYNQCDRVFVPTQSMQDELRRQGVDPHRLSSWSRGVDTTLFSPTKRNSTWRNKHKIPEDSVVCTYVSRLVAEKNTALFCEWMDHLEQRLKSRLNSPKHEPSNADDATTTNEFTEMTICVVGEGPTQEAMRQACPNARFLGTCLGEDLAEAYANSDLFVFPSISETFGNVTLEAMASGVAVVVADSPGSSSLVEDQVSGRVIPVDYLHNVEWVTTMLEDLVMHPSKREALSAAALTKARTFDSNSIQQEFLNELTDMISNA